MLLLWVKEQHKHVGVGEAEPLTSNGHSQSHNLVVDSTDRYMIPVVLTADNPERCRRKHWDPL